MNKTVTICVNVSDDVSIDCATDIEEITVNQGAHEPILLTEEEALALSKKLPKVVKELRAERERISNE